MLFLLTSTRSCPTSKLSFRFPSLHSQRLCSAAYETTSELFMLFFTLVSRFMYFKVVFFFSFKLSACIRTLCSALTRVAASLDFLTVSAQQILLNLLVTTAGVWGSWALFSSAVDANIKQTLKAYFSNLVVVSIHPEDLSIESASDLFREVNDFVSWSLEVPAWKERASVPFGGARGKRRAFSLLCCYLL